MADSKDNEMPMIEAIGLSKFYGPFAAARDVSFSVKRGELVAFGPERRWEKHDHEDADGVSFSE
jgi:ABC-type phosphonate transport system ATPase subunit